MRKFLLFLTIVMVGTTGMAFAQGGEEGDVTISLDNVTNLHSATQLMAGNTHTISIRYDVSQANTGNLFIGTNSFEVYSPDGADWTGLTAAYGPLALSLDVSVTKFLQHYQFNGTTFVRTATMGKTPAIGYTPGVCEKAGWALSTSSFGEDGWEGGVDNDIAVTATITSRLEDNGLHLCVDTVKGQGMQAWEWAYGTLMPTNLFWNNGQDVSGPRCFEVYNPDAATIEVDPTQLNFEGEAGGANPATRTFAVTEANDGAIMYTASETADWINLTDPTGTTPGTVTVEVDLTGLTVGTLTDSIMVTSPAATNTAWVRVVLNVTQGNRPPSIGTQGDQLINENETLHFYVMALDQDGDVPVLQAIQLPGDATFTDSLSTPGTTLSVFDWTPTFDDAGEYDAIFRATDGELFDLDTVHITVVNVNRAPVLANIDPQQTLEGIPLSFGAGASDPDNDALTMTAVDLPGDASFTDNGGGSGTFDWTPTNTQSGFYQVWIIASDGLLADSQMVDIEVRDADGFVAHPMYLYFTSDFGGANPDPQTVEVAVSDGTTVSFEVSEDASWFSVNPMSATTPATLEVSVDLTGLAAGHYSDSIIINEAVSVEASPSQLPETWVYVELTINRNLAVTPSELNFEFTQGAPVDPQTFEVSEMGGDAMSFEATTDATFFTLENAAGTTPGTVSVRINDGLTPGTYNGIVTVAADAINSPLEVAVHATVLGCPSLAPSEVVYDHAIFAGETVDFLVNLPVTSTGPGEIDWFASLPDGSPYTLDPTSGTTPTDIALNYNRTFAVQGQYADTAYLMAADELCPSKVTVITNVTVNRAPSADTVIVVNTPAVPGMRVAVPVIFTNSCSLTSAGFSFQWLTGNMYLDSVSFVGGAVEYVTDKHAVIDNDLWEVQIVFDTHEQGGVPIGSLQHLANLHFSLNCEIEDGDYPLVAGGYHSSEDPIYFVRDCGVGPEGEIPEYIQGGVVVGSASNFVCGYVVDPEDNEIEGATVELWQDYPGNGPLMMTSSSAIGSFAFDDIMVIPFDLYAYKEGYYPGKVENINFGEKGIKIVLQPLPTLTPTSMWVDYYCGEAGNFFLGALAPVGSVVEAWTPGGLLVGRRVVVELGQYAFMPVYRASSQFNDDGAQTGERISFTINGMPAVATGNTIYPAEYAQEEVCLEVRGTQEKECTLFAGWNLVSWNVDTDSDDILDVLAPIMDYVDVVLGFEQGGLTFDPQLQAFSTLWYVDHLSGYWVRIEGISEVTLTVTGLPVPEVTPIPLTTGWNLVSFLPEESWDVADALASVVGLVEFAYGFPDGDIQIWEPSGSFNQLATFDPCNGYWVKVSDDGILTYDQSILPTAAAKRPSAVASRDDGFITNNWMNLYSSKLTVNGVTVTSGTTVTAHAVDDDRQIGSFSLKADGLFGFMPVYADAAGEDQIGMKAGDQFYLKVNGAVTDQAFTWTGNGDRAEVGALTSATSIGSLPTGYSLGQNYPNPFNPSTTISFYMPTGGSARIEVYNVLGRLVATPFEGQALAGENSVVWDGRDAGGQTAASGVYFYRLTADNYTETKKMMLLK